jgi:hypothetical protein
MGPAGGSGDSGDALAQGVEEAGPGLLGAAGQGGGMGDQFIEESAGMRAQGGIPAAHVIGIVVGEQDGFPAGGAEQREVVGMNDLIVIEAEGGLGVPFVSDGGLAFQILQESQQFFDEGGFEGFIRHGPGFGEELDLAEGIVEQGGVPDLRSGDPVVEGYQLGKDRSPWAGQLSQVLQAEDGQLAVLVLPGEVVPHMVFEYGQQGTLEVVKEGELVGGVPDMGIGDHGQLTEFPHNGVQPIGESGRLAQQAGILHQHLVRKEVVDQRIGQVEAPKQQGVFGQAEELFAGNAVVHGAPFAAQQLAEGFDHRRTGWIEPGYPIEQLPLKLSEVGVYSHVFLGPI